MTPEQKAFFQGLGAGILGEPLAIPKSYTATMARAFADGHHKGAVGDGLHWETNVRVVYRFDRERIR